MFKYLCMKSRMLKVYYI